jgi:hypothetical protein
VASLTQDHEQIRFRKQHLGRYLTGLVTRSYDGKMVSYLDMLGKIHTPKAGSRELDVPLVQMNALLGFVSDALTAPSWAWGWTARGRSAPCGRSTSCSGSRTT